MPPSDGCSPPEAFRFAPSLPLRFACGPLPLTCPRVGTGPGGDSRPHLRHCKKAILLIIRGIAIVFVIENYYLGNYSGTLAIGSNLWHTISNDSVYDATPAQGLL